MDIKVVFNEREIGMTSHIVHAKNITVLSDYGIDKIIVEDTDGYFYEWKVEDSNNGFIRIEDIGKGS